MFRKLSPSQKNPEQKIVINLPFSNNALALTSISCCIFVSYLCNAVTDKRTKPLIMVSCYSREKQLQGSEISAYCVTCQDIHKYTSCYSNLGNIRNCIDDIFECRLVLISADLF
jgi:hypothetical protein